MSAEGARPVVAIVTGASRGAGKGIAVALGTHGCTVYVTGRSEREGDAAMPGTIHATAAEVTAAGGRGIAVPCDHGDPAQVAALFDRVAREQGRLDILVNNAAAIHDALTTPGNFWEKPIALGGLIDVGLRSGYDAAWHAARIMVPQAAGGGRGLILFTSAPGAVHYCYGPAYGAHKAGMDKMAADMAVDFADAGAAVAAVSIWMGALTSERLLAMMAQSPALAASLEGQLESTFYTGHVAWALFNDPAMMDYSGRTLVGAELGRAYGITDLDGRFPPSVRETTGAVPREQHSHKIK